MSDGFENLPPGLKQELLSLLREGSDGFEVVDMMALVKLIAQHGSEYPALYTLININEEAVIAHYERTGEVPPGVKLIQKTQESDKVTRLEILRGPISPKKK